MTEINLTVFEHPALALEITQTEDRVIRATVFQQGEQGEIGPVGHREQPAQSVRRGLQDHKDRAATRCCTAWGRRQTSRTARRTTTTLMKQPLRSTVRRPAACGDLRRRCSGRPECRGRLGPKATLYLST